MYCYSSCFFWCPHPADPSVVYPLRAGDGAIRDGVIHPAGKGTLFRREACSDGWRHPIMPDVVVIPHGTGSISVDVIVLQRRPPSCGGLRRARVGQRLREYHDIPRITCDFNRSGGTQAGGTPALGIKAELPFVRARYHRKATVSGVIGG